MAAAVGADDNARLPTDYYVQSAKSYPHWSRWSRGLFYFFPHRAFAAFAAIWERLRGPRAAAPATPPFSPPSRPRATAWGFLGSSAGGSVFGSWPVASRMIWKALWLGS